MAYQNETQSPAGRDILELSYQPSSSGVALETFSVESLLERRGLAELTSHQRLEFELLICCHAGRGAHEVDFEVVEFAHGQIVHVRPGQVHRFVFDTLYQAQLVLLRPIQNRRNWRPGPQVISPDAQARSDFSSVINLANAKDRNPPLSLESIEALRALVTELLGLRADAQGETTVLGNLFDAFERLLGGTDRPPRAVNECAAELGCSTRTLGRACRAFANATPKQMIDDAVALEGQRLLGLGDMSATDVAYRLGFSDLSHFSRFLSRVVGKGPKMLAANLERRPGKSRPPSLGTRRRS